VLPLNCENCPIVDDLLDLRETNEIQEIVIARQLLQIGKTRGRPAARQARTPGGQDAWAPVPNH
jgi:hypothetical protein